MPAGRPAHSVRWTKAGTASPPARGAPVGVEPGRGGNVAAFGMEERARAGLNRARSSQAGPGKGGELVAPRDGFRCRWLETRP